MDSEPMWTNSTGTAQYAVIYDAATLPRWKRVVQFLTRGRMFNPVIAFLDFRND